MSMEMTSPNQENHDHGFQRLKTFPRKVKTKIVEIARKTKKLGQDDPRRIVHSLKVGLALTLVSLFYYFKPLYDGFGVNAMWAVLTVVVVFEFSVGATLAKGLNRMLATLVAGALGVGAHRLATLSGKTGEPIVIAIFVFIIAGIVTFAKFFPALKARYDYGLTIFILTFCLVSVSGYRDDQVLKMAQERLSTVIIGSCTTIIICVCVCPVWVGDDLHNLVADHIEKLGDFLEGFAGEYFKLSGNGLSDIDKSLLQGYKTVLTSKKSEEAMATIAKWEPSHGRFKLHHPWKQYVKIGTLTRLCAYKIEALNGYLNSDIQTPLKMQRKVQYLCIKISTSTGKALKELESAMKRMRRSKSTDPHILSSKTAAENLKILLRSSKLEDADLLEIIQLAAVASLLLDVVDCAEKIAEAVYELASLAQFKSVDATVSPELESVQDQQTVQPLSSINLPHHVITVTD